MDKNQPSLVEQYQLGVDLITRVLSVCSAAEVGNGPTAEQIMFGMLLDWASTSNVDPNGVPMDANAVIARLLAGASVAHAILNDPTVSSAVNRLGMRVRAQKDDKKASRMIKSLADMTRTIMRDEVYPITTLAELVEQARVDGTQEDLSIPAGSWAWSGEQCSFHGAMVDTHMTTLFGDIVVSTVFVIEEFREDECLKYETVVFRVHSTSTRDLNNLNDEIRVNDMYDHDDYERIEETVPSRSEGLAEVHHLIACRKWAKSEGGRMHSDV